jgi:hypothetical protein
MRRRYYVLYPSALCVLIWAEAGIVRETSAGMNQSAVAAAAQTPLNNSVQLKTTALLKPLSDSQPVAIRP